MKILVFALSFFFLGNSAIAQQNHFVYIQSDNKLPFYVKLNDKLYSSSAAGYAIIPKLQKGSYEFAIGFPKNEWPQQRITVEVEGDAGFMLKNFNEKGWALYNIQTMNVSMGNASAGNNTVVKNNQQEDNFTNTLSGVVNTPISTPVENSKKEINPPVTTNVKTEEIPPLKVVPTVDKKNDSPIQDIQLGNTTPVTNNNATNQPNSANLPVNTNIAVVNKVIDKAGSALVYVDNSNGKDTIRIFIPAEPVVENTTTSSVSNPISTIVKDKKEEVGVTKPSSDKKFLDIELENPNKNAVPTTSTNNPASATVQTPIQTEAGTTTIETPKTGVTMDVIKTAEKKTTTDSVLTKLTFNSDCKAIASNDDFFKIRKRMAAENSDDDMVTAAKKLFKAKCYSTQQIQNLSVLFLSDKGKYNFFDAAYPFIHDPHNFTSLQSQLKDEYYITRFKAMIRQ